MSFTFRGVERKVGTIIQPTADALAGLAAKGFLHDLLQRLEGQPAITVPPTLSYLLAPGAEAAEATPLGNADDPTDPSAPVVGDCFWAADLHLAALRSANAGNPWTPTTAQALAAYSAQTGFRADDPSTDQGTDPLAALEWRKTNPYPDGSVLLEYVAVDATKPERVREALYLGVGLMAWADLPDAWESREGSGDVWDEQGKPDPQNGHCFAQVGYDANGYPLNTWGEVDPPIVLTEKACARYCIPSAGGGLVALLDSDAISRITGKCPAGYDLSGLQRLLEGLRS